MCNKYLVTWDMLQIHTKNLAYQLVKVKKWKSIIAVSRGGLVPAALLSRELSIRIVDTLCIASYYYNKLSKIKVMKIPVSYGDDTLIVDDLVDTGGTARVVRKLFPKSYFITIFAKPQGCMLVDNYAINVPQDTWIEQPWDMSISYTFPLVHESKIV